MKSNNDVRIDTKQLHPWLCYKINLLLERCNKDGIYLIITEGFRSKEYQDELYAKGRIKPGSIVTNAKGGDYSSQHQWGVAFDIAINDSKLLYDKVTIKKVSVIAKDLGLAWGGDWTSLVDYPHFYLPEWGDSTTLLKRTYGTFDNFKKIWTKKVSNTGKGLNIWNKQKTEVLVNKLPNGTTVNVMYTKSWYSKVEYKGTVGYMKKEYLS